MKTYRCDRSYLRLKLAIHLLVALGIGLGIGLASVPAGVICGLLAFVVAIFTWYIRRNWRFTMAETVVRTEKNFTKDIDVTTPIVNIQSVSAYEGVLEALFGVGTVEISTASSNGDHVTFRWPFLAHHREIVELLKSEMSAAVSRSCSARWGSATAGPPA
jgi:membrane protein YdbS with pleckstrin-like domain